MVQNSHNRISPAQVTEKGGYVPIPFIHLRAAFHVGLKKQDVLVKNKYLYGMVKDWRKYLDEKLMEMDKIENVRRSTKRGRPACAAGFIKEIEKLTGRILEHKKPGPKGKNLN